VSVSSFRALLVSGILALWSATASARVPAPRTPRKPRLPPSVEVYKGQIRVRVQPFATAPIRGYITKAGRFPVHAVRSAGAGCKHPWYKLGPEAWACSGWLLPRRNKPTPLRRLEATWRPGPFFGVQTGRWKRISFYRSLPALARGRALRLRGTVGFEAHSRILLRRRTYLVTGSGGLVDASGVRKLRRTSLVGIALRRARELPLVIALGSTPLYKIARGKLRPTGAKLSQYAVRSVKRTRQVDSQAVVVLAGGVVVRRRDVALASPPPAPPKGVGVGERWVDVDLGERIVFAMRGKKPVRVMLTSLGTNTPAGIFRVERKLVYKDMQQRYGVDPFYLEAIPYVVFFKGDFAFHGAYWHDGFGRRLSHGCPNLSLADARFVFDWLGPRLPAGFFSVRPTKIQKGGVVRVRGRYAFRPGEPRPKKKSPRRRR
jgi:L,D-transpeptidase catalytic domain